MTQQHVEEVAQIFKRLVAAKRSGSLLERGRAFHDLNLLADHVGIQARAERTGRERN
jgi:hypothetical protein